MWGRGSAGVTLLAALSACAADPATDRAHADAELDTALGGAPKPEQVDFRSTAVVDTDLLPNRWEAVPGWFFSGAATLLGDLDGDGYDDMAVPAAEEGTSNGGWLVVRGPLRRPLTLPGDEYLTIMNSGNILSTEDLDGDGDRDLAFLISNQTHVVLGPFTSGVLDAAATAIDLGVAAGIQDFDGDGVPDYAVGAADYDDASITFGPLSRFGTVAPDIVVDPECGEWSPPQVDAMPDIDGDGVRELRVAEKTWECPAWTMPLRTGTIVPELEAGAHSGMPQFEVIADRSGDGAPDVWWPGEKQVLASPITFDPDGALGSASVVTAPDTLQSVIPVAADLTGDGLGDFLVIGDDRADPFEEDWIGGARPTHESWMFVVAGGSDLATGADIGTLFDMRGGDLGLIGGVGVEDGTVFSLVRHGPPDQDVPSVFVVVDLGPGAGLPAP